MSLPPVLRGRRRGAINRFDLISLRLLLPALLLFLVALLLLYMYRSITAQDRQAVFANTLRSQAVLAARLQPVIDDALREGETDDIERNLAVLAEDPVLRLALVADVRGAIIASTQPSLIGTAAEKANSDIPSAPPATGSTWVSERSGLVISAYPISGASAGGGMRQAGARGALFMVADPAPLLAERAAATRAWLLRVSWMALALALVAWALVHVLVSRRLGRLMHAVGAFRQQMSGISSGARSSGVRGKDEIGQLGRAFDEMMRAQETSTSRARLLTQAVEQSGASVIITDRNGVIEYVNTAFTTITGYSREEAIGRNPGMLSANQTDSGVYADLWDMLKAGKTWRGELLNRRKNGEPYWDSVIITPVLGEQGDITNFVAVQEDVTERKKVEQTLLLNAHILSSVNEGIAVTDVQQKFCFVNPAFSAISGYSAEEVIGKSPKLLSSGLMEKTFYGQMWSAIGEDGRWQGEIIDRRKNGESFPEWLSISVLKDEHGEITHYVSVFSDISERKAAERRITHMAQHDFLTGLPNRMLLLDRMEQSLSLARRDRRKVAVMFLDLDRFKHINDMLGHVIGDKLLQELSGRLARAVRTGDTVSRLGGDEFVVMLPDIARAEEISGIAEKVLENVAGKCIIDGHEVEVTTSIGIAIFPDDGNDGYEMLQHADAAMYHAKQNGRNNYHFFTSDMNRRALERLLIERKLRRALERDEFALYYQPQIDLKSRRMVCVEALLRWNDAESGEMIPPARFIPITEENGMITSIGEWVLREACRHISARRNMGLPDIPVAVNLSMVQFRQKDLAKSVRSILDAHGVSPTLLELEITETAVMQDAETAISVLKDLKDMGVRLAMDDFGTGYSSLSYLRRLPIDRLKIDQSFVRDIAQDPDDAAIVSTIISMARSLKLNVLAEGVETDEQLSFLNRHGCDEGQGYYFSVPLPHDEFAGSFGKFAGPDS